MSKNYITLRICLFLVFTTIVNVFKKKNHYLYVIEGVSSGEPLSPTLTGPNVLFLR